MAAATYTDDELRRAVAESRSWRGVLRQLGLTEASAAGTRSTRRRAAELGLDASHFTGQRRWTDGELASAVGAARSWAEVQDQLGLSGGSSTTVLKGHSRRMGLNTSHFGRTSTMASPGIALDPDVRRLPRAGSLLAAAWFTLCGYDVSWPLEPVSYDLVAAKGEEFLRIQVKTTRVRTNDTWMASLVSGGRRRGPYDPDDIDHFFIVTADLSYYLIPVAVVGGLRAISLAAYARFRVGQGPRGGAALKG